VDGEHHEVLKDNSEMALVLPHGQGIAIRLLQSSFSSFLTVLCIGSPSMFMRCWCSMSPRSNLWMISTMLLLVCCSCQDGPVVTAFLTAVNMQLKVVQTSCNGRDFRRIITT